MSSFAPESRKLSRRHALAAVALGLTAQSRGQAADSWPPKLCVFSKHFQWTDWKETAALSKEVGFDGVDLTVRQGGHVLPERVEDDLPKVAEITRSAGLELPMITAGIVDARSPHAEAIVKTASRLGIRYYRWGGFVYSENKSIADQLADLRPRVKDLADLNREYNICAMYHTHSGVGQVGASIWDLWYVLKDFDSRYVGVNYDIGHATVEGGLGGWIHSARLTAPMMRGVALKDFRWGIGSKGNWAPMWCAPGQGMVNFSRFFGMIKKAGYTGPVQVHFEYPELGGADSGKTAMSISKVQFLSILRRDLAFYRKQLQQAGAA